MDTQFQVEILRLHCEHLRTLLDQVLGELTIVGHELATGKRTEGEREIVGAAVW